MSYFKAIGMKEEPFSTSPDPAFLCMCREHKAALFKVRIAVSLKRGMGVVVGDVGMGKTTLSRKLSQLFSDEPDVEFYMILNPHFRSEKQFLSRLIQLFHIDGVADDAEELDLIEAIERWLFRKGVEERKTVVLLVDEAQMLHADVLESLRILLNYETNEFKLLQLLLVGQMELLPRITAIHNFWDRVALRCVLNPLAEDEVRDLIEFRLKQAGHPKPDALFTDGAIRAVWEHTHGYPRKLSMVCHNALENLVMHDRQVVDESLVRDVIASDVDAMDVAIAEMNDVI